MLDSLPDPRLRLNAFSSPPNPPVHSVATADSDGPQPSPTSAGTPRGRPILIVDDEPDALEILSVQLRELGHGLIPAQNGDEAIALCRQESPVLVVLDLMLPGTSGFDVCRSMRQEASTAGIPILVLSACTDETDRIVAMELGADDYLTKPANRRELILRCRKLLEISQLRGRNGTGCLRFPNLLIDSSYHNVVVDGSPVILTPIEFKLLDLLARRNQSVQSRDQLLKEVWGYRHGVESRTLDTHIKRLRHKLGTAGKHLETVRGVGYRLNLAGPPQLQ
jgi:two-component system phosphate regulon response regulator PhoB